MEQLGRKPDGATGLADHDRVALGVTRGNDDCTATGLPGFMQDGDSYDTTA